MEAKRVAMGLEPLVWLSNDSEERNLIMQVREGNVYTLPESIKKAEELIAEIDGMKPWPIEEKPDEEWMDKWLIHTREFLCNNNTNTTQTVK